MKNILTLCLAAAGALMVAACSNAKSNAIDSWLTNYEKLIEKVEAQDVENMTGNDILININSLNTTYDSIYSPVTALEVTETDLSETQGAKVNALNARWTECMRRYNDRTNAIATAILAEREKKANE